MLYRIIIIIKFFLILLLPFQVFICGAYPHWIVMTARGSLRIHPMSIDGPITCFAPFHNINCPKGFLYFNKVVSKTAFEFLRFILTIIFSHFIAFVTITVVI